MSSLQLETTLMTAGPYYAGGLNSIVSRAAPAFRFDQHIATTRRQRRVAAVPRKPGGNSWRGSIEKEGLE
jgi:hypothetical protein